MRRLSRDRGCETVGVECAVLREQRVSPLVVLSDDRRWVGGPVERLSNRRLEERALLLHNHDLAEPATESTQHFGIDRVGHADVQDTDAEPAQPLVIQTQRAKRGAHLEVHRPARREPDPIGGCLDGHMIQIVRRPVRSCHADAGVEQFLLRVDAELAGDVGRNLRYIRHAPPLHDGSTGAT